MWEKLYKCAHWTNEMIVNDFTLKNDKIIIIKITKNVTKMTKYGQYKEKEE